ncbi:MAG: NAD(P)-dependent oxidoreductase [Magnetococcales bacterium]|nr:NAD(P)-dependent oxidoreductase [Magnetococcales bacterium]
MTERESRTLGFIGLGVMGFHMAGHLTAAGHRLRVYNRTADKVSRWQKRFPGEVLSSPRACADGCDMVMLCVGNDDDLRSVTLGEEGVLAGMAPGTILVDHTTTSAHVAEEIAQEAASRQVAFLDAPVSGGEAGAEQGILTIMVGGDEEVFHRAEPVLNAYGRAVTRMGPVGFGQKTKMVNQICLAGMIQGLAEGLAFAQKAGLHGDRVLDVIGKGAAQSWQMDNRGRTMLQGSYDFGFAVDWMLKDLGICMDQAETVDAQLPVTRQVQAFYKELQQQGHGRWDTSSLMARLIDPESSET